LLALNYSLSVLHIALMGRGNPIYLAEKEEHSRAEEVWECAG